MNKVYELVVVVVYLFIAITLDTHKSGLYVNNQESLLLFGYFFTFVSQADEIAFAFCVHVRVFLWRRVR